MQNPFLRSRTFRLWMVRHLIILLIPMSFSFSIYRYSVDKLTHKAYENGMTAVRQVGTVMDQQLTTIFDIGDTICVSSGLVRLKYLSLPFDAAKYYEIHTRAKYLNNFAAQRSLIDNIFVYCRDLACILDAGHIYTKTNQYDDVLGQRIGLDQGTFDALMQKSSRHEIYITGDGQKVLMLQTLGTNLQESAPPLMLIIMLNTRSILDMLRETADAFGGQAYMLMPDDRRLGYADEAIPYAELSAMRGEGQISDGEQVVSFVDSGVSAFRYVLTVPHQALLEDVGGMRMVFLYFIACTLCLGAAIAYMLARYNYRPVERLKQTAHVPAMSRDDFGAISSKLEELLDTGYKMHTEIERLSGVESEQLFSALLSGELKALSERQIGQLRARFVGAVFVVAVLDNADDNICDSQALTALIGRRLAALADLSGQCAVRFSESGPVAVFCFADGFSHNDAQFCVQQIAECLLSKEDTPRSVSCYVGDAQDNLEDIHRSYENALRAKEYADFAAVGDHRIVLYDETMYASDIRWEKYDIVDAERRFTNLMIDGDYSAGEQVLREILSYYNGHDGMSLYAMRCRMFGVMNMMLNILHEVEPDVGTSFYEETKPVEALLSARTMQELEDVVFQIVERLVGRQEQRPSHLQAKLLQVEHYIAMHYYDQGLGVKQVADRFELSLPYLSREFKREKGVGVLNYINACRIEKAKLIMNSEEGATVAQIADRVGYNSSQTFIRIFKQYEGVTPGQYRAAAQGDESKAKNCESRM